MKTVTADQFKKLYGDAGVSSFSQDNKVQPAQPDQSLTDTVGQDISTRADRVGKILSNPNSNVAEKGLQVFGQGAGLAANTLEQTAMKVPGVKQAAGAIGAGINWLTTSDISPIKALGDVIGNNKTLQTAVSLYDNDQNFKDTIDAVANIARLGGDVDTAVNSANFTANVTNKVLRNIKATTAGLGDNVATLASKAKSFIPAEGSADIMNRVARLNPSDMTEFKDLSGKTPGQYLTETGNFGAPDKIIANEAKKFVQSKVMVDAELAKLPGVYKNGAISDALTSLSEKVKSVSTDNVPASYASEVKSLIAKYNSGGLTMDEINQVKRLFERNVKLGYNKLLNADKVEQATNVDNSIRKWQVQKAKDLGFNNITDLNKQTQLSRFIVDKLGDKVVGQSGLNNIGLTDWIVLSGGTPQSISGFLTKKFFSSRTVQAKIAEYLNSGKPIKGMITPDVKPTIENTLRQNWPEGTKLELPPGTSPKTENRVPIQVKGASTIEAPAQKITSSSFNPVDKQYYEKGKMGGGVNSSAKPEPQPVVEKGKSSLKSLPKNGGYINMGQIAQDLAKAGNKLTDEMRSFVSSQLSMYDNTPLTVNGKISMGNADKEFRIGQLQSILEKRALNDGEVKEAVNLLK